MYTDDDMHDDIIPMTTCMTMYADAMLMITCMAI